MLTRVCQGRERKVGLGCMEGFHNMHWDAFTRNTSVSSGDYEFPSRSVAIEYIKTSTITYLMTMYIIISMEAYR